MSFLSAGLLGATSILGALGSLWTNKQSKKLTREQMEFMKDLSNSAISRSMADMKKAGINPILAAGSPASTPSPGLPQLSNPAESAISSAKALGDLQNVRANTEVARANVLESAAKVQQMGFQDQNIKASTDLNEAKARQIDQQVLFQKYGLDGGHLIHSAGRLIYTAGKSGFSKVRHDVSPSDHIRRSSRYLRH